MVLSKTIKKIGDFCKSISGIITFSVMAVTFIAGTAVKIDRKKQARENEKIQKQTEISGISSDVKEMRVALDSFMVASGTRMERMERTIYDINGQIVDQGMALQATKRTLVEIIGKTPTISRDDYKSLMDILYDVKKNNGYGSSVTVPMQSDLGIQ
jgi:hypothetical protein